MNSIFKHRRNTSKQKLLVQDNSSEDSVDKALRSNKLSADDAKTGVSSFRNINGEPMYLQVKQDGSNLSLTSSNSTNTNRIIREEVSNKKPTTEEQVNPDSLPNHPEPRVSFNDKTKPDIRHKAPKISISRPGKPGKRESSIEEPGSFEAIELRDKDQNNDQLRRRHQIIKTERPRVDTSKLESKELNINDSDYHSDNQDRVITSAISPKIKYKKNTSTKRVSNEGKPMQIRNRRKSSSSSSSNETQKLIAQSILQNYDQELNHVIESDFDENQKEVVEQYIRLVKTLKLTKIFYNPELDVLNRFCLEYTSLCAHTEPKGMFVFKTEEHYSRVYRYMDKRINSTSTPIDKKSTGVEIPILITRLFLGDFRITSNNTNKIGINIPILSHNHKLSLERFRAIVINIFNKKRRYYNTIDISRHELSHLA